MHAPADWYKSFFSGLAVEMWLNAMPAEVTASEVDFLRSKLQLTPGANVLDVPCGGGRHSIGLASAGYQMASVDISPAFLDAARANGVGLPIVWHEREMTDLPWTNTFDGAFCFGNSFGYLSDEDNSRFLHAVAQALKPGDRFVMDYGAVLEALLTTFVPKGAYDFGDIHYERDPHYDPAGGRIVVEHSFARGSQVERKVMTQRTYTYREVCGLLTAAGFVDLHGYGGMNDEPFGLGSKRLLVVATRR